MYRYNDHNSYINHPLAPSYITNEVLYSKDEIIQILKERLCEMQEKNASKCSELISERNFSLALRNKLQEANATIKQLSLDNKYLKQEIDLYEWSYEELKSKVKQLEEALASSEPGKIYEKKIRKLESEMAYLQKLCEKRDRELRQEKQVNTQSHTEFDFFKNCDTPKELEKRKKALISIYHPDSECGDNETTLLILSEYNKKVGYQ